MAAARAPAPPKPSHRQLLPHRFTLCNSPVISYHITASPALSPNYLRLRLVRLSRHLFLKIQHMKMFIFRKKKVSLCSSLDPYPSESSFPFPFPGPSSRLTWFVGFQWLAWHARRGRDKRTRRSRRRSPPPPPPSAQLLDDGAGFSERAVVCQQVTTPREAPLNPSLHSLFPSVAHANIMPFFPQKQLSN